MVLPLLNFSPPPAGPRKSHSARVRRIARNCPANSGISRFVRLHARTHWTSARLTCSRADSLWTIAPSGDAPGKRPVPCNLLCGFSSLESFVGLGLLNAVFRTVGFNPIAPGGNDKAALLIPGVAPDVNYRQVVGVARIAVSGYDVAPIAILPLPPDGIRPASPQKLVNRFEPILPTHVLRQPQRLAACSQRGGAIQFFKLGWLLCRHNVFPVGLSTALAARRPPGQGMG